MVLAIILVPVLATVSFSHGLTTFGKVSRPVSTQSVAQPDVQPQVELSPPIATDSYLLYQPELPLNYELPGIQPYYVPETKDQQALYVPEPAKDLKAPTEEYQPNYYQISLPAQELSPPSQTAWNPVNDPKLYYEVPAILTKQQLPTKEFPKKYNEDIHTKKKPYASKPKQELVLEPINGQQYETKQNELAKTFNKLAKKENYKEIQAVREQPAIQI